MKFKTEWVLVLEEGQKCFSFVFEVKAEYFTYFMVLIFQIVVAFQGTYEEKILKKYDVAPLQAIGWEGN